MQNLRETAADTKDIIRELKEGLWIGRGTRYVTVDFTIYNANINLFCVIKLSFEFPPTGGIVPDPLFNTVKLGRNSIQSRKALRKTSQNAGQKNTQKCPSYDLLVLF